MEQSRLNVTVYVYESYGCFVYQRRSFRQLNLLLLHLFSCLIVRVGLLLYV